MDGAELYKVTKDGDEVLLAIYKKSPNESSGKFIRLEDMTMWWKWMKMAID